MNLLIDPIFQAVTSKGRDRLSLPELLAGLGEDRIESLPGLQRHQEDIFHIFLCYLAGAVLARSGETDPRQSPDFWREGFRRLAGREDDCAWTLVVEDPTRPAFMQPPASSREVFNRDFKPKAHTPDALDVLQNAKNHEVKSSRSSAADLDSWVFALITYQTSSGFLGQGNYGIARMNGGFGSRVCVRWRSDRRLGPSFCRETSVILEKRSVLFKEPYIYQNNGKILIWLETWDGRDSISLNQLDPFFIEICRRVRLVRREASITALGAPSKVSRLASKESLGNIGDPWTPVNLKTNGALTPSKAGFTPSLLRDLIFQENYQPASMQIPPAEGGSGWFCASVLVRGQGTTDGFHEAAIRVPEKARPALFGQGRERDRLADLSQKGLEAARTVQNKVLRPALYALMEGGPDQLDYGKREVTEWVSKMAEIFTQEWRIHFFDWLWTTLDQPEDLEALRPWFDRLRRLAQVTFEQSVQNSPVRHSRSYRSVVRAEGLFYGGLRKQFPEFLEE